MVYVSAKYQPRSPIAPPDSPRPVQAIDDQGQVWALTEDSQVGDWLRYLEAGGTIDPESEDAPSQPQPDDPAVQPVPSVISGDVPRAEPDITMDGNVPRLG
jgi:hypothetical protein